MSFMKGENMFEFFELHTVINKETNERTGKGPDIYAPIPLVSLAIVNHIKDEQVHRSAKLGYIEYLPEYDMRLKENWHTTSIVDITDESGQLIIETKNSIYTFNKLSEEEWKESVKEQTRSLKMDEIN